jgi:DNA-binding HxlR family transcriptional regulator
MGAVLRVLMSDEPRRFNELLAAIPGLSDRLLTERLRELAEHRIVERVLAPDLSPIAVQYRLTDAGRDLEVVVRAISAWARRWRGGP